MSFHPAPPKPCRCHRAPPAAPVLRRAITDRSNAAVDTLRQSNVVAPLDVSRAETYLELAAMKPNRIIIASRPGVRDNVCGQWHAHLVVAKSVLQGATIMPGQWSGFQWAVLLVLHCIYRSGGMPVMYLDACYAVVSVWDVWRL